MLPPHKKIPLLFFTPSQFENIPNLIANLLLSYFINLLNIGLDQIPDISQLTITENNYKVSYDSHCTKEIPTLTRTTLCMVRGRPSKYR
jgi:hypothetical protein